MSTVELGAAKPRLTRAGVIQLQSYDWPGNIRELRNVIERAVIRARGGALGFDLSVGPPPPASRQTKPHEENSAGGKFLTEVEMQQLERENLLAVLEMTGWKIKGADGAAEFLGVKPTTLLSRIKTMGLRRPA